MACSVACVCLCVCEEAGSTNVSPIVYDTGLGNNKLNKEGNGEKRRERSVCLL